MIYIAPISRIESEAAVLSQHQLFLLV